MGGGGGHDAQSYVHPYSLAYLPRLPDAVPSPSDYAIMLVYLAVALAMLGCSTVFHTFLCCGPSAFALVHSLDYIGIVFMISGSMIPLAWYGFICSPLTRGVYIALSIMASSALIYQLMKSDSYLHKVKDTRYNLAAFWVFGLIHGVPFFHVLATAHDVPGLWEAIEPALGYLGAAVGCYAGGSVFFATQFPESCFEPGQLDRFGEVSHAIWHVFVAAAALCSLQCTWCLVENGPGVTCEA